MEDLGSDLVEEPMVVVDDDGDGEFYEEIEAPKYVDFSVPDRSRPDNRSWFCVRVGCDQLHEEVDPEALNRSFFLRVMAARSPNIKLRKALNRQAPSLIPKCPNSAPVKAAKDRITRLSTMTSIPEKIANKKLNGHPISKLRSTPKAQPTTLKKALTTPRSKKCVSNQEVFRSVRHQKEPVAALKNQSVAKALFLSTPKKAADNRNAATTGTPVSEVCAEMKKLNLTSLKKNGTRGPLSKSSRCAAYKQASKPQKKGDEGAVGLKKTLREGIHKVSSTMEIAENLRAGNGCDSDSLGISGADVEEAPPSSVVPAVEEEEPLEAIDNTSDGISNATKGSEEGLEERAPMDGSISESVYEKRTTEDATDIDDNKENTSEAYTSSNENMYTTGSKGSQVETSENLPLKEAKDPKKTFQERPPQGAKCKKLKSTNPKPFRLRTDERGILKEANLERRLQLEAQKETSQLAKHGDCMRQNGVHRHNCDNDLDKGVQIARPIRMRTACAKPVRPAEPKMATSKPQRQKFENSKDNSKKIVKVPSPSLTAARKSLVSGLGREKETFATTSRVKAAGAPSVAQGEITRTTTPISSRGRKLATIPKEPNFHRIHVPKSCTKRSEMVCS